MAKTVKSVKTSRVSTLSLVVAAMMAAITVVLMTTPLGTIRLPVVSVTIAHVPAIVTAIVFGLGQGLAVAFVLGAASLFMAAVSPSSVLDPFFVNPLVSILPRLLIPVAAHFSHKALKRLFCGLKTGKTLAAASAVVIGNLTNTFGVYLALYLVYARQIFEKTGRDALGYILAAISATTLVKCVGVVVVSAPVVLALNRINNKRRPPVSMAVESENGGRAL